MNQKMGWREMKDRFFAGKHNLQILLLAGVLLVVIAMPVEKKGEREVKQEERTEKRTKLDYESEMEEKLSEILSDVQGVGENQVMITLRSTAERIVEKDEETDEKTRRETTVYRNTDEEEVPYVKKEMTPKIEGVVVIAEGGDDAVVVKNITEAVQTLFGVDTHKIKVMKMNE